MRRKLNASEMAIARGRMTDYVETGLPRLIDVPIPSFVRDAPWFRRSRVAKKLRLRAFPGYGQDVYSGKLMPAKKLLDEELEAGRLGKDVIGTGSTSCNWGKDLVELSRAYPMKGFIPVINSNTLTGKVNQLWAARPLDIEVAPKDILATDWVHMFAKERGYNVWDQYTRSASYTGHEWTMNHIDRENDRLKEGGCILGFITGTCSTGLAGKLYLKQRHTNKKYQLFAAASMNSEQKVPGSRSLKDLEDLQKIGGFPDLVIPYLDFPLGTSITRAATYELNAELYQDFSLEVGPTGALLTAAFFHQLKQCIEGDTLASMENERGVINVVLVWIDSVLAYQLDPELLRIFSGR